MSQENLKRQEELQELIWPHRKRNMVTSTTEGVLDAIGMGMIPMSTVITYFISDYVNNAFLIGLLPSLQSICSILIQIMVGDRLQGKERFKPLMAVCVFAFRFAWLALSLLIFFNNRISPLLFVCIFYGIFCVNGAWSGVMMLCYTQLINKIIPEAAKGRFFGIRGAFTSVGSILGAQIGGAVLAAGGDAKRFALLFLVAFIIDIISAVIQATLWEPRFRLDAPAPKGSGRHESFFQNFWNVMSHDRNMAAYVIGTFLITIGVSFFTFQTAHAKSALGMNESQLAVVTTILYITELAGMLFFGWLCDKTGYKKTYIIGTACYIAYLILASRVSSARMTFVMTGFYGIMQAASTLCPRNMVFRMCTYEQRVRYFAVINMTLTLASAFASSLTGALIDWIGYSLSAVICLCITVPGLILLIGVKENRVTKKEN